MARYLGAVCKLCRREGGKLYLKGERCFTEKCAVSRRPYPPGQHGQAHIKLSEYGLRLRRKQKMRRIYGLLEMQFAGYYVQATHLKGRTGVEMLGLMERRLHNLVLRIGFASSRAQRRQLVRHNHVLVNGKRVNIPSFQVRPGDAIQPHQKSKMKDKVGEAQKDPNNLKVPDYLEAADGVAKMKMLPERDSVPLDLDPQLIVEYYSGK